MARPMSTGHTINSLSDIPYNPGWNSKTGRDILRRVSPSAIVAALHLVQPQTASTSAVRNSTGLHSSLRSLTGLHLPLAYADAPPDLFCQTPHATTSANHQGGQGSILSQVVRVSAPMWANSRSLTDSEMQKCQHLGCHFKHGDTHAKIRHYWKTHVLTCVSDECLDEDVAGCRGSPHALHIHLWRKHGIAIPVEAWQKFLGEGSYQLKQCPGLSDQFLRGIESFETAKHAKRKAAHNSKATNATNVAKLQQAHHGPNNSRQGGPGRPGHPMAIRSGHNLSGLGPRHLVPNSNSQQAIPMALRTGHISSPRRTARALSTSRMAPWIH